MVDAQRRAGRRRVEDGKRFLSQWGEQAELVAAGQVVALTETTAAIMNPTSNVTVYRKNNKPALGPEGDSLDHLR